MKAVVIMDIGINMSLGFSKQTTLAIVYEAWDNYRISKVQSRFQL